MNKKIFIRGLGAGLILASLVMFVTLGTADKKTDDKPTDTNKTEAVTQKATKETTEEKTSEEKASEEKTSEEKTSEEKTSEEKTSEEKTSEEKTSEEKTSEEKTSEEKTSEEKTTEEKTTETTTEELEPAAVKNENGGGYIIVTKDMTPEEICDELLEIEVISDKWDYYNWLMRSGYSNSIEPGKYTFGGYESYAGIVWILLGN